MDLQHVESDRELEEFRLNAEAKDEVGGSRLHTLR